MGKPRRGKILNCKLCGAEYYRRPSGVAGAMYCSRQCQYEAFKKGKPRICQECRQSYYVPPAQVKHRGSKFCSDVCKAKNMSTRQVGPGNLMYQGQRIKITRLDAYFSLFIRLRDDFTCQRCKKVFPLGAHGLDNSHYIGRANKRMRYDEENCDALCRGCHQFFETHKVTLYRDWKIEQLGEEEHQALLDRSRVPLKVGSAEWAQVGERVRARLRSLNGTMDKRKAGVK